MYRFCLIEVQRTLLRLFGQLGCVQARLVVRLGYFDRIAHLLGDGFDLLGAFPQQLAELILRLVQVHLMFVNVIGRFVQLFQLNLNPRIHWHVTVDIYCRAHSVGGGGGGGDCCLMLRLASSNHSLDYPSTSRLFSKLR
uniref:Putative secreted protein n=1 Tax=Anopheles triannulatus TaxID=58253 RepID=A0A2M4B1U8_9DIPT